MPPSFYRPATDYRRVFGWNLTTPISIPRAEAAAVTSFVTAADGELLGLTNSPIRLAAGTTSCSSPNSFTATSARGKLMPVALPPGRAKLTRPNEHDRAA